MSCTHRKTSVSSACEDSCSPLCAGHLYCPTSQVSVWSHPLNIKSLGVHWCLLGHFPLKVCHHLLRLIATDGVGEGEGALSLLRLTIWHTHTVSQDKCAVGRCCRGNDARSPGLTWKYKNRNVSIKCCRLWSKEIILHIYIVFIKIIVFFGSHLVFVNFRAAETDLEGGQLHVFPCFYSLTEDQTGLYITGSTTRGLTGGSL